jgi:Major Facilitator Superfamily
MTSGGNRSARSTTTSLEQPDWASIVAVTLSISAFGVALGLTYPLISLVLAARGFGESVVGFNAGVYALGMVTATLLMPRMTNRLSAGRLIVSGLAGSAAIIMGFGLLPSITAWFALRFALGFAINTVFILAEAWLNTACPDHLRGRVTAVFTASMSAGFATGPLGVPVFGKEDGFGFAACAVLVALVTISFALLSRRARPAGSGAAWLADRLRSGRPYAHPDDLRVQLRRCRCDCPAPGLLPRPRPERGLVCDHGHRAVLWRARHHAADRLRSGSMAPVRGRDRLRHRCRHRGRRAARRRCPRPDRLAAPVLSARLPVSGSASEVGCWSPAARPSR